VGVPEGRFRVVEDVINDSSSKSGSKKYIIRFAVSLDMIDIWKLVK
jgi:hypothetical protein